jgi:hypothetical protein
VKPLDTVEECLWDDCLVVPLERLATELLHAGVERIHEDVAQALFVPRFPLASLSVLRRPRLPAPAAAIQLFRDADKRPQLGVQFEDRADLLGLVLVDDQLPALRDDVR